MSGSARARAKASASSSPALLPAKDQATSDDAFLALGREVVGLIKLIGQLLGPYDDVFDALFRSERVKAANQLPAAFAKAKAAYEPFATELMQFGEVVTIGGHTDLPCGAILKAADSVRVEVLRFASRAYEPQDGYFRAGGELSPQAVVHRQRIWEGVDLPIAIDDWPKLKLWLSTGVLITRGELDQAKTRLDQQLMRAAHERQRRDHDAAAVLPLPLKGPQSGREFHFDGNIARFPPKPFDLVVFLWNTPTRSAHLDEVARVVWEHDELRETQLKPAVNKANGAFLEAKPKPIPISVHQDLKGQRVYLEVDGTGPN